MQNDFEELTRKAVKAAIALEWALAKKLNIEILEQNSSNVDAKVRLGKAYLELKDYAKARRCFKEVLAIDPINSVAKKNLTLAKEEKHSPAGTSKFANIIQEPATFMQGTAKITAKGMTAGKISMGVDLEIKVFSQMAKLNYAYKDQKIELGIITEPKLIRKLKAGKDQGANFSATYVKGEDKDITILINSSLPIFDGERQEVKPFTKRDFLDNESENEGPPEDN